MGELITKTMPLRDLKNPAVGQQPAAMSQFVNTQQDSGGVHTNSGIPNNAAFLMTMGGTNPVTQTVVQYGIGWEKSEKVWYRSNTTYFMTTTNFAQAAAATMSAAKDVGLTQNEQNIIDCAWKAVGVVDGTCQTLTDPNPPPPPPVTAPDAGTASPKSSAAPQPETEDPTPRRTLTPQGNAGCSVTHETSGSGAALAGLLGWVAAVVLRRRRRSN
jgi:MYXO-CTERM domain-containing protein